ncbi:ABC transporter ATP-binding protein [Halegenticoccus tardaugens]|uniref:ABC transporter ATP-binding protein n=1 Tax=Halegenticoccus tardaugens TaxID=2071624 RepID=UPI001E4F19DF|nr:ABC transporter ATP-binding protein [Halegenticoccus tardaugens]
MDSHPAITFDGVTKHFGSGETTVHALEDIDLSVADGEFVSLVGPSGCGKSTLLNIGAGLHEPTSGAVRLHGRDFDIADSTGDIGFIFQRPVLFDWRTVRKNILLPVRIMKKNGDLDGDMQEYQDRVDELLSLVGLEGFGGSYPKELSGGMQQRVSICQSLIYDPEILLMDEPFGSLDALTKDQMNEELLNIWMQTNKTILFVTHDLREAVFLSDKIVVLSPRPGRIQDVINVDLPRPRDEETKQLSEYNDLVTSVYSYFR